MAEVENGIAETKTTSLHQANTIANQNAGNKENSQVQETENLISQNIPLPWEKDDLTLSMEKNIEDTVKQNIKNNILLKQKYYFIMGNYFKENDGNYIPAEIALGEYTIEDGIMNRYHSHIHSGIGNFGSVSSALEHFKNLERIYSEILEFIKIDDGGKTYSPVYTHEKSIPSVKVILDYLNWEKTTNYPEINVYSMNYLFFTLKKETMQITGDMEPITIYISNTILDHDKYENERGISCDVHEKSNSGKYCALACIVRWSFIISENLCPDLGVQMLPGRHLPNNVMKTLSLKMTRKRS